MLDIGSLDITAYLIFLGTIVLLIIILIINSISNNRKIMKLYKKYENFMKGENDVNIESLLEKCLNKTDGIINKNKDIEMHLNDIDRTLLRCIQKVSITRFNAFDDTGSDQSYSIAYLDGNDNGVVITSIFARESSTTYGKPIVGGKSKYALSAEEIKVINKAVRETRENQYI